MDNLPRETDLTENEPGRQMWKTYSPIALFASKQDADDKSNHLVPVAIQMDFKPGLVYLSLLQFIPQYTYSYPVKYYLWQALLNVLLSDVLIRS